MVKLTDLAKRLIKPERLVGDSISMVVVENSKEIFETQKKQWDSGKDSEGNIIGYYSEATEAITGGRKKSGEPWNLFNTGELRREIYLDNKKNQNEWRVTIDSESSTRNKLFKTIEQRGLIQDPTSIFGIQKDLKLKDKIQKKIINNYSKIIRNEL